MSYAIEETPDVDTKFKAPLKYNLWALNNDFTSFDEALFILTRACNMSESVAAEITLKIDREGKAKVNPKPMSLGLAQVLLSKVNEVKAQFARAYPIRAPQIMMLKFMIKED